MLSHWVSCAARSGKASKPTFFDLLVQQQIGIRTFLMHSELLVTNTEGNEWHTPQLPQCPLFELFYQNDSEKMEAMGSEKKRIELLSTGNSAQLQKT